MLEVAEFEHVPHVCKRDYQNVLQHGMTYVRPRGKPESVPVPSSSEMREMLDLAVTKGVRAFIRRAGATGVELGRTRSLEDVEHDSFVMEAAKAWAEPSPVLEFVLRSGFTDIAIQPGPFDSRRLSPARLKSFVEQHAVRLRGWPVPYIDHRTAVDRHGKWIGQDVHSQVVPHVEAWRMCTSGQFLHRRVLATDLRNSQDLKASDPNATGTVAVWDILLYLVEVAELAARMAVTLNCSTINFEISLRGLASRELISGDWRRELEGPYIAAADRFAASEHVNSAQLFANPRDIGVGLTQQLLGQFGLDVPDHVLKDWQEQILDKR